jgi:ABC-type molybdate transport system substrate-binding protein
MKALFSICMAAGLVIIAANPASSAELKIFGSRVTKMIVEDIGPQFEQASGHHLIVVTDVAAVMKRRIEAGEAFDHSGVRVPRGARHERARNP